MLAKIVTSSAFALIPLLLAVADDPYTSKAGNFRATFPAAPKTTRLNAKGVGGDRVTAYSYAAKDRSGAVYSVNYADYPSADESTLDAAVDGMIKSAKMRPGSRESIALDGHPGREVRFEVDPPRGTKAKGVGRARAFLVGKRLYQVMVVGPEVKLTDDAMTKFVESFALLNAVPAIAEGAAPAEKKVAMPAPPASEAGPAALVNRADKPVPVDPDGDCKITPSRDGGTIAVPAKVHDLSATSTLFNAPRLVREVSGDFVIEARVNQIEAERQASRDGVAFRGSGLVFWQDKDHFIRLERAAIYRDLQPSSFLFYAKTEDGKEDSKGGKDIGFVPIMLKMERKGGRLLAALSETNGKTWQDLPPMDISGWKPGGQVGIHAINTTAKPLVAQFEAVKLRAADVKPAPSGR